jgi:hypothetical protein
MHATDGNQTEAKPQAEQGFTSLRLRKETLQMLKDIGRKGESYDDIIRKLLVRRRRS